MFKAGDVDFVQALANVLGDVVERQLTDDDIRHRALHDPLTGLPNRLLFLDRLGQATERQRRRPDTLTAVLALDLDRFKLVNESLGHRAGDELLAAAAPRLRQAVRSADTVARFSGDEFGILLEDIAGEQDAIDMAERIAGVFTRPFVLGRQRALRHHQHRHRAGRGRRARRGPAPRRRRRHAPRQGAWPGAL